MTSTPRMVHLNHANSLLHPNVWRGGEKKKSKLEFVFWDAWRVRGNWNVGGCLLIIKFWPHSLSHIHFLSLSVTPYLSLSLSLSLTHTHTHTHFLSFLSTFLIPPLSFFGLIPNALEPLSFVFHQSWPLPTTATKNCFEWNFVFWTTNGSLQNVWGAPQCFDKYCSQNISKECGMMAIKL